MCAINKSEYVVFETVECGCCILNNRDEQKEDAQRETSNAEDELRNDQPGIPHLESPVR